MVKNIPQAFKEKRSQTHGGYRISSTWSPKGGRKNYLCWGWGCGSNREEDAMGGRESPREEGAEHADYRNWERRGGEAAYIFLSDLGGEGKGEKGD